MSDSAAKIVAETERLLLRRVTPDDFDDSSPCTPIRT